MKNKKSNVFIIVLFLILAVLVVLFPKIYSLVEKKNLPKVEGENNLEQAEEKVIDQELLDSLHYPIMRSSKYSKTTYYSLDTFKIYNMTNNDILYNAFLDIYEGNMTYNGSYGCTDNSKQFNETYIDLRIKNILGKNTYYVLNSFYVYEDADSNYVGNWIYDSYNKKFIYSGLCNSLKTPDTYYDLEQFINAEYKGNDVIVDYYVGFAKVENNEYIIYKDPNMTEVIDSGNINGIEELNTIFENLNNKDKKKYEYVFKNTLCTYNEYCLYEGKWIN